MATRLVFLDAPGGALPPEVVLRAMSTTIRASLTAPGAVFVRSRQTGLLAQHARAAIADLTAAKARDIVLGPDVSMLADGIARALARGWRLGDEIVLSRLDDEANIRPWLAAARSAGVQVRWAQFDLETFELPVWQFEELIGPRTRLVALPAASTVVGAAPDVAAIAGLAHQVGAVVSVSGSGLAPHAPLDLPQLGADLLSVALGSIGGPRVAAIAAAPGLLDRLDTDWPGEGPAKFERAGLSAEQLSGAIAAVDHLAELLEAPSGELPAASRREHVVASLSAVGDYERPLFEELVKRLRDVPGVSVMCAESPGAPNLALQIGELSAPATAKLLDRHGICAWHGDGHAPWLMADLGADDPESGGVVTLGLMPYVSRAEIERVIVAISAIAAEENLA